LLHKHILIFLTDAKTVMIVSTLHAAWGIDEMLAKFLNVRQSLNEKVPNI